MIGAMTIRDFIDARLQDDHTAAYGGKKEGVLFGERWKVWKVRDAHGLMTGGIAVFAEETPPNGDEVLLSDGETAHIERHDPARVLRQVKALRQVLALAESHPEGPHSDLLAPVLAQIASIWSDHPDYQPEWISD
jgi:hypothetical protein